MAGPVDRTAELSTLMAAQSASLASKHDGSATAPRHDPNSPPPSAHQASALFLPSHISASHPFTVQSCELLRKIRAMRAELVLQRRRYADFSLRGMSDASRDALDASVVKFLKMCVAQIDVLKADAVGELTRRRRSVSEGSGGGASFPAHCLGGIAILSEELQGVSALSEELRGARIRAAIDARAAAKQVRYDRSTAREAKEAARERDRAMGGGGPEEAVEMQFYEQEFASENAALVGELVETREQLREAERSVVEIASLNHVFATKVLEQAKEIETLYDLAVEASMYVDRGNKELRRMKGKGQSLKLGLALLALLLGLVLLLMDMFLPQRSLFSPI